MPAVKGIESGWKGGLAMEAVVEVEEEVCSRLQDAMLKEKTAQSGQGTERRYWQGCREADGGQRQVRGRV